MPTQRGSYMCEGQKAGPGETSQVKSQTLLNKRRHLGAMSLGITTTCNKSDLLCLLLRSSSRAASATAGGGAIKTLGPCGSE